MNPWRLGPISMSLGRLGFGICTMVLGPAREVHPELISKGNDSLCKPHPKKIIKPN